MSLILVFSMILNPLSAFASLNESENIESDEQTEISSDENQEQNKVLDSEIYDDMEKEVDKDMKLQDKEPTITPFWFVETQSYDDREPGSLADKEVTYIRTVNDFQNIKDNPLGNYKLLNDLDFKDVEFHTISTKFLGILDGNNNTIKNLKLINKPMGSYFSIFSFTHNSIIKNINFENIGIIDSGNKSSGGIISGHSRNTVFENISVSNSSFSDGMEIGVISANIIKCFLYDISISNIEMSIWGYAGCIAATSADSNMEKISLNNIKFIAQRDGWQYVGLVLGNSHKDSIKDVEIINSDISFDKNSRLGTLYGIGGISGSINEGTLKNISIISSNFEGQLIGGIAGDIRGSDINNINIKDIKIKCVGSSGFVAGEIANSKLNEINVSGENYIEGLRDTYFISRSYVGAISEKISKSTISNCFIQAENLSIGKSSDGNIGIIASELIDSEINNSLFIVNTALKNGLYNEIQNSNINNTYFNNDIEKMPNPPTKHSRTTNELKNKNTYVGWDLNNVWKIDEGKSFPTLRWLNDTTNPEPGFDEIKIVLDDKNFENQGDNFYLLNKKIDKIEGKIIGDIKPEKLSYKIKIGHKILISDEINLSGSNNFTISNINFIVGLNLVDFVITDSNNKQHKDFIIINNENESNQVNIIKDLNDNDGDGLKNYFEELFGTDKNKADTDGDGINDYSEIFVTFTDTLVFDIFDFDEDKDEDGLTLKEELRLNGNDESKDTDGDGLDDYEESKLGTLLNNADSDDDGLSDYMEVYITKTNPLNSDTNKNGIIDSKDLIKLINKYEATENEDLNVIPSVEISIKGEKASHVSMTKIPQDDLWLSDRIPGYLGNAFDFNTDMDFDSAIISFEYKISNDNPGFKPRIYYYNENEKTLELLPDQIISGNKISAKVNHFSSYTLLDSDEHEKLSNMELPESIVKNPLDIVFMLDLNTDLENPNTYKLIQEIPNLTKRIIEEIYEGNQVAIGYLVGNTYELHTDFTSDKTEVYKAINEISKIKLFNSSSANVLPNAIHKAMASFPGHITNEPTRQLVVLTSGYDHNAPYANYSEVINYSKTKGIQINVINTNNKAKSNVTGLTIDTNGKYYGFASLTAENYLVSKMSERLNNISDLDWDKTKDTDSDGILDYYEETINMGFIRDSLGRNLRGKLDVNDPDTDGDGLKDGEEIEIKLIGGSAKFILKSDPSMEDTDGDGIYFYEYKLGDNGAIITIENDQYNDKNDPAPLIHINCIDKLAPQSNQTLRNYNSRIEKVSRSELPKAPLSKHTTETKLLRDREYSLRNVSEDLNSNNKADSNLAIKAIIYHYAIGLAINTEYILKELNNKI